MKAFNATMAAVFISLVVGVMTFSSQLPDWVSSWGSAFFSLCSGLFISAWRFADRADNLDRVASYLQSINRIQHGPEHVDELKRAREWKHHYHRTDVSREGPADLTWLYKPLCYSGSDSRDEHSLSATASWSNAQPKADRTDVEYRVEVGWRKSRLVMVMTPTMTNEAAIIDVYPIQSDLGVLHGVQFVYSFAETDLVTQCVLAKEPLHDPDKLINGHRLSVKDQDKLSKEWENSTTLKSFAMLTRLTTEAKYLRTRASNSK